MKKDELQIKIDDSFKFYLTCFMAAGMHLTFLVTFMIFKMYMMVCMNIVSVLLYVISGVFALRKGIENHPLGWIIAAFAEILLHAVLCTLIQGLDVFFFLYPPMALPLYAYYLFVYCDRDTYIKTAVGFGMVTLLVLVFLVVVVESGGSIYSITGMHVLSHTEIIVFRGINILFTLVMLTVFVLVFYLEVSHLLSELQKSNLQLNYIATHDSLTGLKNRHSLWKYFEELRASGESYCIIMGDLDDFKKINDTYGHDCGDIVLKSVASVIIENTNDDELACRWGGEEILIVMRGSHEDCYARISVIKSEISSLGITSEGRNVKVTMTFGFADSTEEEAALEELNAAVGSEGGNTIAKAPHHIGIDSLISMVDKRLYIGKRSGKNVIVCNRASK